ncbi:hypothetical protein HSX11_24890 [Oxalobacteraceae bacterium]|nr:hypothetical protein [Oxalobacteraceae bacterium]
MFKFSENLYFLKNVAFLIASTLLFAGCTRASQSHETNGDAHISIPGWKTVCIGRFLVDLPPSAELGATKVKYGGAYGFSGINNTGSWGTLRWEGGKIAETMPTDFAGFDDVRIEAKSNLITPEMYKKLIQYREKDVAYWINRSAKSPADEVVSDLESLKSAETELQDVIHASKISKEAELQDKNGFAIRLDDEYIVGFRDLKDQRVRTFSGGLSKSENESGKGIYEKYENVRKSYHPRAPTDIPAGPGFCTNYGFIEEPQSATVNVEMRVPIQIKELPNLLLVLEMEPASPDGPRNIQKIPNMDTGHIQLDKVGIKQKHGPKAEQILGTPGRSYAQEYGDNCSSTSCRPADQAYDMEAKTFGEPGRVDRPQLTLLMIAATSDDYKLKRPAQPNEPSYNTPSRPALSGHVPPPFKVGQEIFEQVLHSIRLRPGAIAGQSASTAAPSPIQK